MSDFEFRQQLEKANNPEEVRQRIAAGNYNQRRAQVAQEWIDSLEREELSKASARRDAREEETLSIAKDALAIAKDANRIASEDLAEARSASEAAREQARWAKWAAIIAMVAAVIAAKENIVAFIFG